MIAFGGPGNPPRISAVDGHWTPAPTTASHDGGAYMVIFSKDGPIEVDEDLTASAQQGTAPGAPPGEAQDVNAQLLVGGESRKIFRNTGYPWAINGRILTESNGGNGSGILVGKNLVLTALHCVNRKGLKQYFIPASYVDPPSGKAEPYGRFEIVNFYRWADVSFSGNGNNDEGANDYAVLKLAGEPNVGWAGTYGGVDAGWINRKMWYHVGYPVNNKHGLADHKDGRPCYEMDIAIQKATDYTHTNKEGIKLLGTKFFTTADCEGGQSGGALFNIVNKGAMVSGVLTAEGPPGTDSGFAGCHPRFSGLVAWCQKNA